jgi:hypothetical protein
VPETITVRIPFRVRKRGGRKLVVAPGGQPWTPPRARIDSTLVKAIARAFRWQKLLETGVYASIEEIAKAEDINPSYVSRILRLTLLAPTIVQTILDGRHSSDVTLSCVMKPFSVIWNEQFVDRGYPDQVKETRR